MNFFNQTIKHKILITGIGAVYNMFGKVKKQRAFIIDLTEMIDYKVTNTDDLKWLYEFRERIKNKYLVYFFT